MVPEMTLSTALSEQEFMHLMVMKEAIETELKMYFDSLYSML